MTRWSNSCRSVLSYFLLLLGSTPPLSSPSPTATVGAHLRPREPIPQEWVPPQTVTVTETTHYTLTVLATLTVDPGMSTSMVISETSSATKSTTTLTSTTTTTITPSPTAAPKARRQALQQPSTVTVTTTMWGPDVTITSTISFTAPAASFTTITSMSAKMTTDIVTERTTTTRIVTATATAGIVSAAGQSAARGKKKGPKVEVIVGTTFAVFVVVVALLVALYMKLAKGKEGRGGAIRETGAAGAAGAKKGHALFPAGPMNAIKSLLPGKRLYNPVPAADTNLLNPPYNPANTSFSSRSFPPPPQSHPQPHQNHHSYISYSPPPAQTFPPTYLPVSPVAPRLPHIQVTRANTTSTVSSLSSSGHSDPPVPIHPLTTAGAKLPAVQETQFHALTTAGEERMMSPPPQEGPVEPEASWYSLHRGGSGSSGGGGGGVSDWRRPFT